MQILYVGYLFPEGEYAKKKALSFAAGRFEKGLIKGLYKNGITDIVLFSIEPQLCVFPKGRLIVRKRKLEIIEGIKASSITYVNLPFLKHACIWFAMFFHILKWALRNRQKERYVISYNADVPIIQLGLLAEKIGIKYMPVLADLPFYEKNENGRTIKSILSEIGYRSQIKNIKKLKTAMVLNMNSAIDFAIPHYVVVDGAINEYEENFSIDYFPSTSRKNILCCGSLDVYHGTDKLLEIADKRRDFEIFVLGRGRLWAKTIRQAQESLPNLFFFEDASDEIISSLYKTTDLLIIPHPTHYKQLRYQFPSKLMTCMATGIPVVLTPVPGVGKEYSGIVNITEDDSVGAIIRSIDSFFEKKPEDLKKQGKMAREFVLKNKTWEIQAQRIIDFLKGNIDDACVYDDETCV